MVAAVGPELFFWAGENQQVRTFQPSFDYREEALTKFESGQAQIATCVRHFEDGAGTWVLKRTRTILRVTSLTKER